MSDPKLPSYRELVELPVGFESPSGELIKTAEVRPVNGGDELYIGMSR